MGTARLSDLRTDVTYKALAESTWRRQDPKQDPKSKMTLSGNLSSHKYFVEGGWDSAAIISIRANNIL